MRQGARTRSAPSWVILLFVVGGLTAITTSATAQFPQRRYQPQTATISPYLNLLRVNPSGLPNYYSLVRPQLEFDSFRRQQTVAVQQQQLALDALQSNAAQTDRFIRPTGTHGRFFDTGSTAGFMSPSHYYTVPNHPRLNGRR